MLFEQNIASNVTRNVTVKHTQACPCMPKCAKVRPCVPMRAQVRPSASKHAQASPSKPMQLLGTHRNLVNFKEQEIFNFHKTS